MPLIWKGKALVAGALIAFTMGGCQKSIPPQTGKQAVVVQQKESVDVGTQNSNANNPTVSGSPTGKVTESQEPVQEGSLQKNKASKTVIYPEQVKNGTVAPLFNHGDGGGAMGCIVVSPPVFVNEDEARQIIEEELKKGNFIIDCHNVKFREEEAIIKADVGTDYESFPKQVGPYKTTFRIVLDGYSKENKTGYVLLSVEEALSIDGLSQINGRGYRVSSAPHWDTEKSAEKVRNILKKLENYNAVVFYTPGVSQEIKTSHNMQKWFRNHKNLSLEDSLQQYHQKYGKERIKKQEIAQAKAYEKSKHLLRLQVRDFIEWAKNNGLIKNKK